MPEQKIPYEDALVEITTWLDHKKIGSKKREQYKDAIETLVYAMVDGDISLDSECNIIQVLKFPIKDKSDTVILDRLKYKSRIDGVALEKKQGENKGGTGITAIVTPYVAALTDQTVTMIKKLDTEDSSISNSVGIFFM